MFDPGAKIFAVGIGGAGLSGLGRLLAAKGCRVAGSDVSQSAITRDLQRSGIAVTIGHREENLPDDAEVLIYSAAIPASNPERRKAQRLGLSQLSYAQAVGELAKFYFVIAVAGTNGKTTTAAMIATMLTQAGKDPTVLIGSQVLGWNSNARLGRSKYFVLEADEYRRAFLNYRPNVVVITNIAVDHLDYFQDLADIKRAFTEFVAQIQPGGAVIFNGSDARVKDVLKNQTAQRLDFRSVSLGQTRLRIPGEFNRENAQAAAAVGRFLGISAADIATGLQNFTGTERRFEHVGNFRGAKIYSDYAHHPDGIRVTLKMLAELYPPEKVLIVFQPHQHNRTKNLFAEFVQAFCQSPMQHFIFCEIFDVPGREQVADQSTSSKAVVAEVSRGGKQAKYAADLADCEGQVRAAAHQYQAVVFMGAGDIYKVAESLIKTRANRKDEKSCI